MLVGKVEQIITIKKLTFWQRIKKAWRVLTKGI